MFGISWCNSNGNITYLICPLTPQDYVIKDHVTIGIHRKCISRNTMFLIDRLIMQDQVIKDHITL